jgi:uncharacterized protein YecT (DUF1311 family)
LVAAGLAGLAGGSAAMAQPCTDQPTQSAMNRCANAAYRKVDTELNAAYREIMTRFADDQAAKKRLTAVQRVWIAFRDAECAFVTGGSAEGSLHPYLLATCLQGLTGARLAQLRAYLDCQEGDLTCPVPAR